MFESVKGKHLQPRKDSWVLVQGKTNAREVREGDSKEI